MASSFSARKRSEMAERRAAASSRVAGFIKPIFYHSGTPKWRTYGDFVEANDFGGKAEGLVPKALELLAFPRRTSSRLASPLAKHPARARGRELGSIE